MRLLVNSKYCLKQLHNCGLYTKYSLKTKSARSSLMRVFCIGVSPLDQSRRVTPIQAKLIKLDLEVCKHLKGLLLTIICWQRSGWLLIGLSSGCIVCHIKSLIHLLVPILTWYHDMWTTDGPKITAGRQILLWVLFSYHLFLGKFCIFQLLRYARYLFCLICFDWLKNEFDSIQGDFFSYKISCSLDLSKSFLQLLFMTILVPKVVIGVTWILSINLCNHWQVLYLGNSSTSWQWRDTVHFYTIDFFSSLLIHGVWGTSVFFSMINLCFNSWIMLLNFPGGW